MQVVLEQSQLGVVLKMARSQAGISEEYMAKRCKCSQTMVSLMEKGEREPSLKVLRVYAEETGQSAWISLASSAYIGRDDIGLVNFVSQSVKAQMAVSLLQA